VNARHCAFGRCDTLTRMAQPHTLGKQFATYGWQARASAQGGHGGQVKSSTRTAMVAAAAIALGALTPGLAAATSAPSPTTGVITSSPSVPKTASAPSVGGSTRDVRRLIVRTTSGRIISTSIKQAAAAYAGVASASALRQMSSGSTVVELSAPVTLADAWTAANELTARGDVISAEPDRWFTATVASPVTTSDSFFPKQWDMWDSSATAPAGGYSSKASQAWLRTTGHIDGGPTIVVAVLDTGITQHVDLAGQTVAGYDFVSDPLTANDGDGRDANPSDPGDWISAADAASNSFAGCAESDSSWHGTHVSGTIAALHNSIGISGIAPGVKIQPVRILGKCGGELADVADAIEWASGGAVLNVPANATPASVINLSLGGPGPCTPELQTAITDAYLRGTTVVVAAGNENQQVASDGSATSGSAPADCDHVIAVTATGRSGARASYSNFGTVAWPAPGSVALAAQGGGNDLEADNILSTVNTGLTVPEADGYAWYAGTSMAAPHVAAAVALMQSLTSTPLLPDDVVRRLRETATPFTTSSDCTAITCGAGILNIAAALPTPPAAPEFVEAIGAVSAVSLTWTAANWGGSPITGYHIEYEVTTDSPPTWQDVTSNTATTGTTFTVSTSTLPAFVDGVSYLFRVSAISQFGETAPRDAINAASSVTSPVPDQVTQPSTAPGVETFTTNWTQLLSGANSYYVQYHRRGKVDPWVSVAVNSIPSAESNTLTLAPWTLVGAPGTYDVRVAAVGGSGIGPSSEPTSVVVSALTQTATASASIVRPFHDGFQDSVTLRATSNNPRPGTAKVLDAQGVTVISWPLGTNLTPFSVAWTGLNSARVRVKNGTYRFVVTRPARADTPEVIATRTIVVAASQVTVPAVTLSRTTVYPYHDGYADSIGVQATATVPATYTIKVIKSGRVLFAKALTRRQLAAYTWLGVDAKGVALPAGTYILRVTALGGEGSSRLKQSSVVVSSKRLKAVVFTTKELVPSALMQARTTGVTQTASGGYVIEGADDPTTPDQTELNLATFRYVLPASVKPVIFLQVWTCADRAASAGSNAFEGFYNGPDDNPNLRPAWLSSMGNDAGCYTPAYDTGDQMNAPSFSVFGGALHFWVGNGGAPGTTWGLDYFLISGTKYVLV